ncbi:MAG: 5-formyltetrahydrofolate cyclo-ligase [Flavobacteriaceae bacterium]|nr:5-formyltetrahydrofolate cyclo-ligase [Flavobacteriaceae bacterium]
MNKQQLRKKYTALRNTLSDTSIDELSQQIANQCLNLTIWQYSTYHLFLSIKEKKEVETWYLLHILQGRDKQIAVATSNFKTCTMQHYLLTEQTRLKVNNYGIPEPISGIQLKPTDIDVVFVPLLVYDQRGHRIGYGKGFYDRFLSECRPDIVTVGLSFFQPEIDIYDTQPTDIKLDYVVSPESVYSFD